MTQILSSLPLVSRLIHGSDDSKAVQLEAVPVHAVETSPERRPRTLKHLLRANHVNYALVHQSGPRCYNHLAPSLCAAYLLGASSEQMHDMYDQQLQQLEPWTSSPAEVVEMDWRDFLGDRQYQRAYVDFFEDVLASHKAAYNWQSVVDRFLFATSEPLVNNLIGGLGHPLIHLACAYEMDSRVLAMEALASASISYGFLHRYADDRSYTRPAPPDLAADGTSLPALLARVAQDSRFSDVGLASASLTESDSDSASLNLEDSLATLFSTPAVEAALLEYWNAWTVSADPTLHFRDAQETAVALLVATVAPGTHSYNVLFSHIVATSHAARVLLPNLPARYHVPLLRQWWLLTLAVYVLARRPALDTDQVPSTSRSWTYVETQALSSRWHTDAHYIKVIRSMQDATRTWGDVHNRYLNAAVRFVDDFEGWTS